MVSSFVVVTGSPGLCVGYDLDDTGWNQDVRLAWGLGHFSLWPGLICYLAFPPLFFFFGYTHVPA